MHIVSASVFSLLYYSFNEKLIIDWRQGLEDLKVKPSQICLSYPIQQNNGLENGFIHKFPLLKKRWNLITGSMYKLKNINDSRLPLSMCDLLTFIHYL